VANESFEDRGTGPFPITRGGHSGEKDRIPVRRPPSKTFRRRVLRHEVVAGDEHVVFVEPGAQPSRSSEWLKDDPDQIYNYLSDVTAVDFGGGVPSRWSTSSIPSPSNSLRLKVELPLSELEIDSVVPLWKAANWLEREVYDMFGVTFRNHPDLRRILMPENYAEGHPLRKDFPLGGGSPGPSRPGGPSPRTPRTTTSPPTSGGGSPRSWGGRRWAGSRFPGRTPGSANPGIRRAGRKGLTHPLRLRITVSNEDPCRRRPSNSR
jgi:NADH:ubiquinone oxidoreductase subunit C